MIRQIIFVLNLTCLCLFVSFSQTSKNNEKFLIFWKQFTKAYSEKNIAEIMNMTCLPFKHYDFDWVAVNYDDTKSTAEQQRKFIKKEYILSREEYIKYLFNDDTYSTWLYEFHLVKPKLSKPDFPKSILKFLKMDRNKEYFEIWYASGARCANYLIFTLVDNNYKLLFGMTTGGEFGE